MIMEKQNNISTWILCRFADDSNNEGEKTNLEEKDIIGFSERIGIAAVKYYDLRMARTSDYRFDYDKMLANNGII